MALRRVREPQDPQAVLAEWFADYAAREHAPVLHVARSPRKAWGAARALHLLPTTTVAPADTVDGSAVARALHRGPFARLLLRGATAALAVPRDAASYLQGPSRKMLRQYVRSAERSGLTVEPVADADRAGLLALADARERSNPRAAFRTGAPDNQDMLRLRLWLVTRDAAGVPLLLTVVAVDSGTAVLRYHRTLVDSAESSLARYLAMPALLARLDEMGASTLFERSQPQWLPPGLRLFQRRTGFTLVRVRLRPARRSAGLRRSEPR